ncbi:hypothetical protein [Chitinophaga rhizosphaerae]|uniref:hypothetical protein n=1 Tax=Chitinophaga rhizosphaerae TaxID=1864947 RepID=UPI000F806049|nr:hypothetical protein [Chitinophaga rhizosphaerae]
MADSRKPSALDKIRAHYLEGRKLSEKQELKRKQYEQANAYRVQGYSVEQCVHLLRELGVVGSVAEAYRIIRSAEELFGDVTKSNKDGLRHILSENFMRVYRKAWKDNNLKEANRALENIAEINGLRDLDGNPIDWNRILIPIPVFSSDPDVLRRQETVDISHQNIGGDE